MKVLESSLLLVAMALAATGCGKSEPGAAAKPAASAPAAHSASVVATPSGTYLFQREALQPLSRYTVIDRTKGKQYSEREANEQVAPQYRQLFWSGAQLDYDLLAYDFLPEARQQKDAFKLSDIAKGNQAKLDAEFKAAKQNNRFALYFKDQNEVDVIKYDPATKGFKLGFQISPEDAFGWYKSVGRQTGSSEGWGVVLVGARMGGEADSIYVPASEAEARKIESKLVSRRINGEFTPMPVFVLGHVVGAVMKPGGANFHNAIMVVDGLAVQDPETKEVLFTFDLGKKEAQVSASTPEVQQAVYAEKVAQ